MKNRARVFWFTGLSGSGKSTVASAVKSLLDAEGYSVLILDGDDVRRRFHADLGFSEEDIKKNNSLIAQLCETSLKDYDAVFVPIISPYASSRQEARTLIGDGFLEIYFAADLDEVMKRDVKGLYAKAKNREITNLIGYSPSNPYEPPAKPDFVVQSGREPVEESNRKFYHFVKDHLHRPRS
jgi:adenylyl-sulfate kinase